MKLELIPVVRYWDYSAKDIDYYLDRLVGKGAKTILSFVPWAHLETDRHHLLKKFVRICLSKNRKVKLVVTPELGIGYQNNGIPDDLLRDRQNHAQDRLGNPFYSCVAPNIHPLISLLAPVAFQRYGHFLLKFSQELTDICAEFSSENIEVVITDSLFKHYCNAGFEDTDRGDYSLQHLRFNGYKTQDWNPQMIEKIFFSRAHEFLKSKLSRFKNLQLSTISLATPSYSLDRLLDEVMCSGPNYYKLFDSFLKQRAYCSSAWMDDLSKLKDRERNFLISSSSMIFEEVWMSEDDYLGLSNPFRAKMAKIKESLVDSGHMVRNAKCLVKDRFSSTRVARTLQQKLGVAVEYKVSLSDLISDSDPEHKSKLLVVEEGYVLEHKQTLDLLDYVKNNECTAVVFKTSLCEKGIEEFRKLKTFRLNHGWFFEIGVFASGGNVLLVESADESGLSIESLCDSLVSAGNIDPLCEIEVATKAKITTLTVDWKA
ncbi:MAG: hypothetical protein M9962_11695, partial [Oligoflexia bacterium]|nr:hypothetical protein [Oligoflexia bacterium]